MSLKKKIGYTFENPYLLVTALTHSSYSNEKRLKKYKCNERLEFLGDAVLELISKPRYIFKENPQKPEGDLTRIRASYVCEPTLAACARDIVEDDLLLGKGEDRTGGRERDSILSDAMEATIGAVYLDGGFARAKEYVEAFVLRDIENKKLFYDSKTILQEIVQGRHLALAYQLVKETGPDHCRSFEVAVMINGKKIAVGTGRTRKSRAVGSV